MKRITISLDDDVARWLRIRAAENHISISHLVENLLKEKMREEEEYRLSMERFLTQKPRALKEAGACYPKREELYDR